MSRLKNNIKRILYYRANLMFPGFFKKRFFANLHKGLKTAEDVKLLPEKEILVLYFLLPANSVAVDVGANNGAYSYFFKEITKSSRVLAFEPLPNLFKKLKSWLKNIELFNLALSDRKENTSIRVPLINNKLYESRAKLDDLKEENENGIVEIKIQTDTLDAVIDKNNLSRLDIIKIDIEGHELAAIRGAVKSIRAYKPYLMVEIEGRHHDNSINKPVEEICSLGYTAWFFSYAQKKLVPFSEFNLVEMQNIQYQNTLQYINNILFFPETKIDEVSRLNEKLNAFFY